MSSLGLRPALKRAGLNVDLLSDKCYPDSFEIIENSGM